MPPKTPRNKAPVKGLQYEPPSFRPLFCGVLGGIGGWVPLDSHVQVSPMVFKVADLSPKNIFPETNPPQMVPSRI